MIIKLNRSVFLLIINSQSIIAISEFIIKELDSELGQSKFLKTKIRTGKITTELYDEDQPEVGSNYISLPLTLFESTLEKDGKYYAQNVNVLRKKKKSLKDICKSK